MNITNSSLSQLMLNATQSETKIDKSLTKDVSKPSFSKSKSSGDRVEVDAFGMPVVEGGPDVSFQAVQGRMGNLFNNPDNQMMMKMMADMDRLGV